MPRNLREAGPKMIFWKSSWLDLDIVKLWSAKEGEKLKDGFGILPKITGCLLLGKNKKRFLGTLNSVLVWLNLMGTYKKQLMNA